MTFYTHLLVSNNEIDGQNIYPKSISRDRFNLFKAAFQWPQQTKRYGEKVMKCPRKTVIDARPELTGDQKFHEK